MGRQGKLLPLPVGVEDDVEVGHRMPAVQLEGQRAALAGPVGVADPRAVPRGAVDELLAGGLGLGREDLQRHIGWDAGAEAVTRRISEMLQVPAFLAGYSRLFVECNRMRFAGDFVAAKTDGYVIPGNQKLQGVDISLRKKVAFDPFHTAVTRCLDRLQGLRVEPVVVSIHSFTPQLGKRSRPWCTGVLWKGDSSFPNAVVSALRKRSVGLVGVNQPYDASTLETMTLDYHAIPRGLFHVIIEIRKDLIRGLTSINYWAEHIAGSLLSARMDFCVGKAT